MSGRDWLIFEDTLKDPLARMAFDHALEQVRDGSARARGLHGDYPKGFMADGRKILGTSLLQYMLECQPIDRFDADGTQDFTEKMRALLGWNEIDYTLHTWLEKHVCAPFFFNAGSEWGSQWVRRPQDDAPPLPDGVLRFACHVAVCDLRHGPSYASVRAHEIFGWVTQLGCDLPQRLKSHGSGDLPKAMAHMQGEFVTAKANDVLAVVRISVRQERQQAYAQVLDYLVRLLTTTGFPRSYAIEFRGPTKTYLPSRGLPRKGVNQLFACAAAYPALHPLIEAYARAAIGQFHWYQNLEAENCAMPGSFAVFALAFADARHAPLVLHYLKQVDGEHQSLHGRFVEAYIDMHGFTAPAIAFLMAVAGNIQYLRHRKDYAERIANRKSLELLLKARESGRRKAASSIAALRANLAPDSLEETAFRAAREVIWGEHACQYGGWQVIDAAPEALKPLYEQVFA